MTISNLGKTAKYVRRHRKLTLRFAADLIDISHVHLCNIENGKGFPSMKLLEKLKEVYGVDLMALNWCLNCDESLLPVSVREPIKMLAAAWRKELGI